METSSEANRNIRAGGSTVNMGVNKTQGTTLTLQMISIDMRMTELLCECSTEVLLSLIQCWTSGSSHSVSSFSQYVTRESTNPPEQARHQHLFTLAGCLRP